MEDLQAALQSLHRVLKDTKGLVVFLTGAGISAESGIPTFRGKDGYWTVGSQVYHPQEMATRAMFQRCPEEVWAWYLYRRDFCRKAVPNPGHTAVVGLEHCLGDRFRLITQNVDGLHLRAGNTTARTHQIHGNIHFARCLAECGKPPIPLPEHWPLKSKSEPLGEVEKKWLRCDCGSMLRPHILWFDECYDEAYYAMETAITAVHKASALIVVGTTGATNLPMQLGQMAFQEDKVLIDINPEDNPFARLATRARTGYRLQGPAGILLPQLAQGLLEQFPSI